MMKFPVHSSWFPVLAADAQERVPPAAGKPSNRQTVKPSNFSMRTGPRSGTVLMETVLCLPLILMLLTGIVQFTRIWEARLFTRYAAYNAARAALVYNMGDYGGNIGGASFRFNSNSGPVWLAAVNTLAWKSHTSDANGRLLPGIDDGYFPNSGSIERQVRIVPDGCFESNGLVKVTVAFAFPLIFPVFNANSVRGDSEAPDDIGGLVFDPLLDPWHKITLTESCILPKPWSTAWYPLLSVDEKRHLSLQR